MVQSESADESKPYSGKLTSEQAASAMQAARLNAVELLKTSEILFDLKQFAHSVVFSTLAIEEAGKLHILLNMLLKSDSQKSVDWKPYRQHRAKTEMLNLGIRARVRAVFPDISLDQAKWEWGRC